MSAKKIVYILQNRICPRLFLCRFNESTIKWRVQCCCCCLFTQFPRIDPEKWEQFQLQLLVLWNQCLYCGLKTSSYKTSIAKKVDFSNVQQEHRICSNNLLYSRATVFLVFKFVKSMNYLVNLVDIQ